MTYRIIENQESISVVVPYIFMRFQDIENMMVWFNDNIKGKIHISGDGAEIHFVFKTISETTLFFLKWSDQLLE